METDHFVVRSVGAAELELEILHKYIRNLSPEYPPKLVGSELIKYRRKMTVIVDFLKSQRVDDKPGHVLAEIRRQLSIAEGLNQKLWSKENIFAGMYHSRSLQ